MQHVDALKHAAEPPAAAEIVRERVAEEMQDDIHETLAREIIKVIHGA